MPRSLAASLTDFPAAKSAVSVVICCIFSHSQFRKHDPPPPPVERSTKHAFLVRTPSSPAPGPDRWKPFLPESPKSPDHLHPSRPSPRRAGPQRPPGVSVFRQSYDASQSPLVEFSPYAGLIPERFGGDVLCRGDLSEPGQHSLRRTNEPFRPVWSGNNNGVAIPTCEPHCRSGTELLPDRTPNRNFIILAVTHRVSPILMPCSLSCRAIAFMVCLSPWNRATNHLATSIVPSNTPMY